MRYFVMGLVFAAGLVAVGTEAQAQIGGLNDPSFAYYALYLPRQAAQAAAPGPEATLNAIAANRQFYAATNRNGMFDPNYNGSDSLEFGFESSTSGRKPKRALSGIGGRYGVHGGNLNGLGPQGYYNNQSLARYYRDLKTGRGKNANVSVTSSRRGYSGGGYGGVGGVPGPR